MSDETKTAVVSLDAWAGEIVCPVCGPASAVRAWSDCDVCEGAHSVTAVALANTVRRLALALEEAETSLEYAQDEEEQAKLELRRERRRWEVDLTVPLERAASELGLVPTTDVASAVLRECEQVRRAVGQAWFAGGATLTQAIERKCAALEKLGGMP